MCLEDLISITIHHNAHPRIFLVPKCIVLATYYLGTQAMTTLYLDMPLLAVLDMTLPLLKLVAYTRLAINQVLHPNT